MASNSVLLPTALLVLLGLLVYRYILYPTYLSPLSKVPNAHPTACISSVWITWNRYNARESVCIYEAHRKFGTVVRLGPNELSINCVNGGIRTVYGGGFEKHDFYPNQFDNFGVPCMFSTRNNKPHSQRKRLLSNVYAKSTLHGSPTIDALSRLIVFDRVFPQIDMLIKQQDSIEIYHILQCITMDLVSGYLFGYSQGTNFIQDTEFSKRWFSNFSARYGHTFWFQEMPNIALNLEKVGIHVFPQKIAAGLGMVQKYALGLCQNVGAKMTAAMVDEEGLPENKPVVYRQLWQALEKEPNKASLADYDINTDNHLRTASEMFDHLAAGFETSGITLVYLFHELAMHPKLQTALRSELRSLPQPLLNPDSPEDDPNARSARTATIRMPSNKEIDSLPLLHAIILETLRLHQPIPGCQPRITPSHASTTLGDPARGPVFSNIPGNVRISASAYSLHRDPVVFKDPFIFSPSRWMGKEDRGKLGGWDAGGRVEEESQQEEEERIKEQHRWFWAFGSGGRMCVGSHLAMLQMKLIVTTLISNYRFWVVEDSGMEQMDAFPAPPKGGELWLGVEKIA